MPSTTSYSIGGTVSGLSGSGTVSGAVSNVAISCAFKYWTWVSGSNLVDQFGVYGTQGTAAAGNVPGARSDTVSWMDGSGKLWLFGGVGYDSTGTGGELNDLWIYQP